MQPRMRIKKLFWPLLSSLSIACVGIWLLVFNLGCGDFLIVDALLRRYIVFEPSSVQVVPGTTSNATAEMRWADEGIVESGWEIFPSGVNVISNATYSPQKESTYTKISFTGADYDALYGAAGVFTTTKDFTAQLPVVARYLDPFLKDKNDQPIARSTKGYLPLQPLVPQLNLEAYVTPHFKSNGLVSGVDITAKATVSSAPEQWKYQFLFEIQIDGVTKVQREYTDPYGLRFSNLAVSEDFASLTNSQMTVVTAADGKSASASTASIEFAKDTIDGIAIQSFTADVTVKAAPTTGTSKTQLKQGVLSTFGGNNKNYWSQNDYTKVIY